MSMRYAIRLHRRRSKCKSWGIATDFYVPTMLFARVLHLSGVFHSPLMRIECIVFASCLCEWEMHFDSSPIFHFEKMYFYCVLTHLEHHYVCKKSRRASMISMGCLHSGMRYRHTDDVRALLFSFVVNVKWQRRRDVTIGVSANVDSRTAPAISARTRTHFTAWMF